MKVLRMALMMSAVTAFGTLSASAAYSPSTTDGWVPGVGHAPGSIGTFVTDLWIYNPSTDTPTDVTVTFHNSETDGTVGNSATVVVAPRETRFFPDFLPGLLSLNGSLIGNLRYVSDAVPVLVSAHIYLSQPAGTYGVFESGVPASEALGRRLAADDTATLWQMYGLANDPGFRTNVDVTNTSAAPVTVILNVVEPQHSLIVNNGGAGATASVLPFSNHRFSDVLSNLASGYQNAPGLRVTVAIPETASTSAACFAVASVLDVRTGDTYVFPGQRQ